LLSNAIKFTLSGFINLLIFYDTIKNILYVIVQDSGVGIAIENQRKIFTKMGTFNTANNLNPHGNGLGLNLCKQLITLMDGDITFISTPNIQTDFKFYIKAMPTIVRA